MKTKRYKRLVWGMLLWLQVCMPMWATHTLQIPNTDAMLGSTTYVPILLSNDQSVVAFQFDIQFPEDIQVTTTDFVWAGRQTDHQLSVKSRGGNSFRVIAFSPTNAEIQGQQGMLLKVAVTIPITMEVGVTVPVSVTNAIVTNRNGDNVLETLESGTIQVIEQRIDPITNLIPADQTKLSSNRITFSWRGYDSAQSYRLFLWKAGESEPDQPHVSNIRAIRYFSDKYCQYDTHYQWRVEGLNEQGAVVARSEVHQFYIRPTANLHVTSVDCGEAWAGQTLDVSWEVRNDGQESTGETAWQDYIFLTSDISTGVSGCRMAVQSVKLLDSREFYKNSAKLQLDERASGTYYLVVAADMAFLTIDWSPVGGIIPESYTPDLLGQPYPYLSASYTGNKKLVEAESVPNSYDNFFYKKIEIQIPALPDLQVLSVSAPSNTLAGQSVQVMATIANQGSVDIPANKGWYDQIAICPSAEYDPNTAVVLDRVFHTDGLVSGATYTATFDVTIPKGYSGDYYFYVLADCDDVVYEHALSENNRTGSNDPIAVAATPVPDLVALSVEVPAKISNAASWTIRGKGENRSVIDMEDTYWYDAVYASTNPNGLDESAIWIGSLSHVGALKRGEQYDWEGTLSANYLPVGSYYIYVKLNAEGLASESKMENNVVCSESPVQVEGADLTVSDLSVPAYWNKGTTYPVSWTIHNEGAAVGYVWIQDRLIFRDKFGQSQLSYTFDHEVSLSAGESTVYETSLLMGNLPGDQEDYTVEVEVNFSRYVPEISTGNNSSEPLAAHYTYYQTNDKGQPVTDATGNKIVLPVVDLSLQAVTQVQTVTTSSPFMLDWQVQNNGEETCDNWKVSIYTDKRKLLKEESGRQLPVGEMQSGSTEIIIADQDYQLTQLLVEVSINGSSRDGNPVDNQVRVPLRVQLAPLPDLKLRSLQVIGSLVAGQEAKVVYAVENIGKKSVSGEWTDKIYLTESTSMDGRGHVASKTISRSLAPGQSYKETLVFRVPEQDVGNYNLFVSTNNDRKVYEGEEWSNNYAHKYVTIGEPTSLPCDLTVEEVEVPSHYLVGDQVQLSWTIRNSDMTFAAGMLKDAIYLSEDAEWDVSDILVGTVSRSESIEPGESIRRTATGVIRGVLPGSYYLLVRTNQLNRIDESDYVNNTGVSSTTCQVDFQSLSVGSSVTIEGEGYYRLAAEAGETLQLHLEADGTEKGFQLYLSHDKPVSVTQYDYISAQPNHPYQEILVPEMKTGTYYILAQEQRQIASVENSFTLGVLTVVGEKKQLTLDARLLQFGITRMDKAEGGNVGSATSLVEGAKFDSIMDYRLKQDGKLLPAEAVYFQNSSQSMVTFRLDEEPTGTYDVEMEKVGGLRKELKSGYRVIQGAPNKLLTRFVSASSIRQGLQIPVTVEYANEGNSDVVASAIVVRSANGHPMGLTTRNLKEEGVTELYLPLQSEGNNQPRSVAPGEKGSFTIYVLANSSEAISLESYVIE